MSEWELGAEEGIDSDGNAEWAIVCGRDGDAVTIRGTEAPTELEAWKALALMLHAEIAAFRGATSRYIGPL